MYDNGLLDIKRVPVPVISVGNLSVGGSGKTSLVAYLSKELSRELSVCIVLRGYKRRSRGTVVVSERGKLKTSWIESGDEAFLLAKTLPNVSVVVSEDRYEGARLAIEKLGAQLIVLDDGFQHRRLHRDIDIVLLRKKDLENRLLPEGTLREPLESLSRADAIVLSYQEIEPFDFLFGDKPVFKLFRSFSSLLDSNFREVPIESIRGREVIAFSGLGSNEQFLKVLKNLGFKVKKFLSLRDHYDYRGFKLSEKETYITTPKDMVKLPEADNVFALNFTLRVEGLLPFIREKLHL